MVIEKAPVTKVKEWRSVQGDMSDSEWELIADLFAPYWRPGKMGRPVTNDRRAVVDAIFYVAATGCQWRALPDRYPNWNTVHRYHLKWSRDGTWEAAGTRLREQARLAEGRPAEPTAGVIDARSVRGASTVTSLTRGYDAGKKISGRKTFGIVDTLGLLVAVVVLAANVSDNAGGIEVVDATRTACPTMRKLWCDGGFKKTFIQHCRAHKISAEVVARIHAGRFDVLPRRWVVERTWSWLMNNRRLQVDYERVIEAHVGFVWVAQTRILLRRLTVT